MKMTKNLLGRRSMWSLIIVGLAVSGPAAPLAVATQYTFTEIANLGSSGNDYGGVGLNDSGQVAYYQSLPGGTGLYVGNGTTTTQVAYAPTNVGSFTSTAATINNSGTVAYSTENSVNGVGGIYSWNDGVTQTLLSGAAGGNEFYSGGLNNAGQVAYYTISNSSFEPVSVVNAAGVSTTIADSSNGLVSAQISYINSGGIKINDSGNLAFIGETTNQALGNSALFVSNGSQLSIDSLQSLQSPSKQVEGGVSINNQGVVVLTDTQSVYEATPTSNGLNAIFTVPYYEGATILYTTINNQGELAVAGEALGFNPDGSPISGVFAGTSLTNLADDAVIQQGQSIFGQTFSGATSNIVMNDNGQLAFVAELNGGGGDDFVVMLATPVAAVPEPSGMVLGSLAAVGMGLAVWRKRRRAAIP